MATDMEWAEFKRKTDGRVFGTRNMVKKAPGLTEKEKDSWYAARMLDYLFRMKIEMGEFFTERHFYYIALSTKSRFGARNTADTEISFNN